MLIHPEILPNSTCYPDWSRIWSDLVHISNHRREDKASQGIEDRWHRDVQAFHQRVIRRWQSPDSSRQFVRSSLQQFPNSSLLDIGAGSGSWSCMLANDARSVTALDVSAHMLEFCQQQIDEAGLKNVKTVLGAWPDTQVESHDISLCSHAMYGSPDLKAFIRAIQAVTRKRIILLMRAPLLTGIMAQASQLVFGYPFDSPNYSVAINILLEMGIFPNVIMEDGDLWQPWRSESFQESLIEMKSRLGVAQTNRFDTIFSDLLSQHLHREGDEWIWPAEIRTACVYWDM